MTWKEFKNWMTQRSKDGMWGYCSGSYLISVYEIMLKLPFWKRKHAFALRWRDDRLLRSYIYRINQEIKAINQQGLDGLLTDRDIFK